MAHDVVGYVLLALLALQYGAQPFLTSRFLSRAGCDSRAVVLVTELAKAALCACSLGLQRHPSNGARWRAASDVLQTAAPAACYLVQNLAMQRAYADLDSLTFNCLNQTKLVATALFLFVLLRQRQSRQQLVALAMLLLAGVLLQLTGEQRAAGPAGSGVKNFRRGVAVRPSNATTRRVRACAYSCARTQACLLASALSGLASTLTQISLQAWREHIRRDALAVLTHPRVSGEQQRSRSSAAFTLQMARLLLGCLTLYLPLTHQVCLTVASHRPRSALCVGVIYRRHHAGLGACASSVPALCVAALMTRPQALLLRGWTPASFVPVLSQALGGIVVGLVTKRLGGISKGFAVVGGLAITGVLQSALERQVLNLELYVALLLVVMSTWLHGRHDAKVKAG